LVQFAKAIAQHYFSFRKTFELLSSISIYISRIHLLVNLIQSSIQTLEKTPSASYASMGFPYVGRSWAFFWYSAIASTAMCTWRKSINVVPMDWCCHKLGASPLRDNA
jgi:hypothetical protein